MTGRESQTDREWRNMQTDVKIERKIDTLTGRLTDRQTDTDIGRQSDRQTDRQTGRQADKQTQ